MENTSMISVLIPTHSSPDSLDLLLRSLIEGAHKGYGFEIIVGVDGTKEINQHVIDKYKQSEVKFLIYDENTGLPNNTNVLVSQARYEYILILNDDNVAPLDWNDILLQKDVVPKPNQVISPNQIEPFQSIFPQFHIKNLGRDPKTFDLDEWWEYESNLSFEQLWNKDNTGSTLPIYMRKVDFMKVGGWDVAYPSNGIVCDIDFFFKCRLNGMEFIRIYDVNFYHFVSLTVNDQTKEQKRRETEALGHEYARFKWGDYLMRGKDNIIECKNYLIN